jgi:hypothetical protein
MMSDRFPFEMMLAVHVPLMEGAGGGFSFIWNDESAAA